MDPNQKFDWDPIGTAGKRVLDELKKKIQLEEERRTLIQKYPFQIRAHVPYLPSPRAQNLCEMPVMSIKDAKMEISSALFTKADEPVSLFVQVNSPGERKLLEDSEAFQDVIRLISQYQVGSFDTEGKPEATALLIGDIQGRCIAINNLEMVGIPESLKGLLEDPQIRWLQSNVEEDVKLVKPYASVKSWIDSGIIYRACVFDEPGSKFGRGVQAEFVGQKDFPFWNKARPGQKAYGCEFGPGPWSEEAKRHAAQDVRVPLALALKCTINYMESYGYGELDNVIPFLHNLLHSFINLHHNQDRLQFFEPHHRPWLPKPEIQTGIIKIGGTNLVHDLLRITEERKAFQLYSTDKSTPMFPEPPLPLFGLSQEQARLNWGAHELPKEDSPITWTRFCRYCGGQHRRCELRSRKEAVCLYPLCVERGNHRSHTIRVCNELHKLCELCGLRGHYVQAHEKYCIEILQRVFLKWAPFGLYTSLVYLDPHCNFYWKYFLNGIGLIDSKIALEAGKDLCEEEVVIEEVESDDEANKVEASTDEKEREMELEEISSDEDFDEEVENKLSVNKDKSVEVDIVRQIDNILNEDAETLEIEPSKQDLEGLEVEEEMEVSQKSGGTTSVDTKTTNEKETGFRNEDVAKERVEDDRHSTRDDLVREIMSRLMGPLRTIVEEIVDERMSRGGARREPDQADERRDTKRRRLE